MKKHLARVLVLVLAAFAIAGCGGGGGDDGFDFGGVWVFQIRVTASNVPGIPVGETGTDTGTFSQDGTNLTVTFPGVAPLVGTCDPDQGSFSVQGTDGPIVIAFAGQKVGDDSMSGTSSMTGGGGQVLMSWTADRAGKVAVTASGAVAAFRDAF